MTEYINLDDVAEYIMKRFEIEGVQIDIKLINKILNYETDYMTGIGIANK